MQKPLINALFLLLTLSSSTYAVEADVDEQPFTRVLSGVVIPAVIRTVTIRSHDSVHGYGGKVMSVSRLPCHHPES